MREASSSSSRLACRTPCGSPSMRIRLLFSLSGGMRTDTLHWSLILFTGDMADTAGRRATLAPTQATTPGRARGLPAPHEEPRLATTQRDHMLVPP